MASANGKCNQHKGWWREGKDELATHSMTTQVWISTRGQISEATRMAIQEALEEESTKDTPSFGKQDLDEIHRSGTEEGLLGIYNFPGQYMLQTDRTMRRLWELATLNWTNTEAVSANWAEATKEIPLIGLN